MPTYSVRLPHALAEVANTTESILRRVNEALDAGLAPTPLPAGEARHRTVRVPVMLEGRLHQAFPVQFEAGLGRLISQLAWSAHVQQSRPAVATPPAPATADPFAGRPDQARYHAAIRGALEADDAIVLAEGGTGLGKGRVLAALAAWRGGLGETVVVASPSIQVLGQNLAEYRGLAVERKPAVTFLLGAQEFVCATALRAWIVSATDRETADQAQAWIDAGAGGTTPETAIFHAAAPGIGWLLDDLLHAAPEVAGEEVRLAHRDLEDEDDPGGMSYLAMRQRARDDATVLFCTHAALVWDERLKAGGGEGMLPPYQGLLVDEAHLLAGVAEQAFSTQIAFRTLIGSLHDEPTWRSVRALSAARHAGARLQALMEILQHDEVVRLQGGEDAITPQLLDHLRPHLAALEKALEPLADRKVRTASTRTVEEALSLVRGMLKRELAATVTFSPVRRFPSITAGPRSLRWFFEALWERVARVALVSATLYLPRELADESYGLIKTSLHLPADRIRTFSPVIPRWLYAVALHVPSAEDRGALTPPQEINFAKTADYLAAMAAWHDALAARLAEIYASAAGGVLVLLPGYEPILELGRRLETDLGPALIVQQRGGFRAARKRFVEAAREDLRCLWLGTGPAWTGLDLNAAQALDPGITPERDRLLTDLVLPRVPLGTEHSSIHQARRAWMPTAERDRAAFQFRQGIGRLMRREGVRDRRLWVLDGRIWEPSQKWLFAPVKAILKAYQR